jgi:hypothetical protein
MTDCCASRPPTSLRLPGFAPDLTLTTLHPESKKRRSGRLAECAFKINGLASSTRTRKTLLAIS